MFTHADNQKILWDLIQKSPFFLEYTPANRETWFKDILADFYYKNPVQPKTAKELLEINKRVLSHMTKDLQNRIGYTILSPEEAASANLHTYNVAQDRQAKEEEMKTMYSKYQTDYHSLLQTRAPNAVEWNKPAVAEEKIKNMEELIEQQIRQREMDLAKYPNPQTAKIKILEDAPGEIADIISAASSGAKSVSWSSSDSWTSQEPVLP